jgi:Tol biopolymer transport system component
LGFRAFDVWVHEFARNTSIRLTSHPAWDWLPVWSRDGKYIAYSSERDDTAFNLYRKLSNAAGEEELLLKSREDKIVQDWSHDGRFLLYAVAVSGGRTNAYTASHDLWVLPITPGKPEHLKPQPYLQTEFNETQGKFSHDGRFIAYRSDASGSDEVYVRPFPAASSGSWKVSTQGGFAPQWSRDGKEMFYISADSKMMVVKVSADPVLKIGIPKALFPVLTRDGPKHNMTPYDVTADGKKFLIISGGPSRAVPIMVVLNWTALLKQ